MKLVRIYDVVKDETFLVDLPERELTFTALVAVIQERVNIPVARQRLVYNNRQLKRGHLPSSCLREPHDSIHLVPSEVANPFGRLTIFVKINGAETKPMQVKGFRYSSTIEELKLRLFGSYALRPSRTEIRMDGKKLIKEHCSFLYYGISHKTVLEAIEIDRPNGSDSKKIRIFVRPNYGKAQVHWVETSETIRSLKESVYEWTGIPIQHQRLAFGGMRLEDGKKLRDYKIQQDSTINIVRSRGDESSPGTEIGWRPIMTALELDHYAFLFGRVVNNFRHGKETPSEIVQYLFYRWRDHMLSAGEKVRNDIKKFRVNTPASQFFFEVRPLLTRSNKPLPRYYFQVLWTAQEILKSVPANPPWPIPSDRLSLGELKWTDETTLKSQTEESTPLLLRHSRLVLSQQSPTPKSAEQTKKSGPRKPFTNFLLKTKTTPVNDPPSATLPQEPKSCLVHLWQSAHKICTKISTVKPAK